MRGRGTWTAVLTWSIKHARRVDQAGNQGRDGAAVRGRERGEGGMAVHGGTARDCGALWQAGTVPRRHERSVAGREGGGGRREGVGNLLGGASRVSRQARDERRQTAGRWKASSELRPRGRGAALFGGGGTLARSSGRRCRRPRSSSGSGSGSGSNKDGGTGDGRGTGCIGSVLVGGGLSVWDLGGGGGSGGGRAYVLDRETEGGGEKSEEDRRLQSWCPRAVRLLGLWAQPKAGLTTLSRGSVSWLECGPTGQHRVCRVQRPNVSWTSPGRRDGDGPN